MHGDCPMRCMVCAHRCEFHEQGGACGAVECGCTGWVADDDEAPDDEAPEGEGGMYS